MAPKDRGEITEETRLPLKMVIAIVIGACALVGWASRVESGITAWAKTRKDVDSVDRRLAIVQGDLRLIKAQLGIPKEKKAEPDPEDQE